MLDDLYRFFGGKRRFTACVMVVALAALLDGSFAAAAAFVVYVLVPPRVTR